MASGADTHTHTHTHIRTEVILRNQARAGLRPARAWFKKKPYFGHKSNHITQEPIDLLVR